MSDINTSEDWTITDPDTNQQGRRVSTYKFEFKEDGKDQKVIDLETYSWKQICDICESFYPNMDELFSQYGPMSCWTIAECIYESE
jgi:hypothetical protein